MRLDCMTNAAIVIQKNARMYLARKHFIHTRNLIVMVQSTVRGMFARKNARYIRQTNAAKVIQTEWRRYQAYSSYQKKRNAAIVF